MNCKIRRISLFGSLMAGIILMASACMKDQLDLENISNEIELNPSLAAPIVKGEFTIKDLFSDNEDSVFVFEGDSIKIVFRQDSIFSFNFNDFTSIPDQGSTDINFTFPLYIPALMPDSVYLDSTVVYELALEDKMRLDSALISGGAIRFEVNSSFRHSGKLIISSDSILVNGEPFNETIQISTTSGDFHEITYFDLNPAALIFSHPQYNISGINFKYRLVFYKNPGEGITAGDNLNINITVEDLDNFDAIFGYAGDLTYNYDTIIETDLGDISGLTGDLNITNPTIRFKYDHSFGLPLGFDLKIMGIYEDTDTVKLEPGMQYINASDDYRNPDINGSITFSRSNIPNIDDLLKFPTPIEIGFDGTILANPEGDTTVSNFVLDDSQITVGIDIEVPFEFRADIQFRDTFNLSIDDIDAAEYIESADLHYWFTNEFPVNIGATIFLYDSISSTVLDTIRLNDIGDNLLLTAAPVDSDGITIIDEVVEQTGKITLTNDEINNLVFNTNKIIVVGEFSSIDTAPYVTILNTYKIKFKFGIEARAHYEGDPNEDF
ncbi:MAG: hypothetical protein JXJ22_11005 [Bacteroidales bacterium]|nr:hypothetical protein [Bacteroidales bacterium]